MTRILKTSGFLGLATMMCVGLYQNFLLASGQGAPGWMVGGHAHLGVLSILAVVVGFAVPALGVVGRMRRVVTGLFVVGQWFLPLTIWIGEGAGVTMLMPTSFLWGLCLVVSMLLMAYVAATGEHERGSRADSLAPADD